MKQLLILVLMIFISYEGLAAGKKKAAQKYKPVAKRAPASRAGGGVDDKTPIEIHGQTRNLDMLLILQNENEAIDFIKLRKNYQDETKGLNY